MKTRETIAGKTWVVTSPNGCTVTQTSGSTTITTEVPANTQTLVVAQSGMLEISDDAALVTEVGGSAELIYRVESGAAAQSGAGCECEPYELTAEAIQKVVPMAWSGYTKLPIIVDGFNQKTIVIGGDTTAYNNSVIVGHGAGCASSSAVAIGNNASSFGQALAAGERAQARAYSVALGRYTMAKSNCTITIGANFDDTTGQCTCTTEGTGSITIGAGANTLNNGDTESSNSVTIGCKALNQGADSVVMGASAANTYANNVIIGAAAKSLSMNCVAVGSGSKGGFIGVSIGKDAASNTQSVSLGGSSSSSIQSVALGYASQATEQRTTAIGANATVKDYGTTVIRSTAEDGTYTQLYFSGANTPLANTYHDGAPMLGYVTKDAAGNIVAAGTRSLIDLLTDNSTFAPASLDENGEWVQPKVFHPSDLDMPIEEPTEPEEYQPLPVYPIVEPEIPEEL